MAGALDGLRVLEIGGEIAAPYATKLLCELGADVVKVEPADGDPLRTWRDGALFRYLNGGKQSVMADLLTDEARDWLTAAVTDADLVIESLGAGGCEEHGVAIDSLFAANPRLALVRISDFGQDGPYVGIPTSGFTLQALGAWVSPHGVPNREPVQVGARIHEYTAGTYAAAAALSAMRSARQRGEPAVVDLSVMECLVGTLPYPMIVLDDMLSAGRPPPSASYFPLPGIVRCRDGWVGINCLTGQQFVDACVMLEVEEYGPRQSEISAGGPLLEEFFERIQPWLDARDAQEIVELGQAFRVPTAPVGDGAMLLDYAQLRERPFFVEEDGVTMPGPPYRLSSTPAARHGHAPELGSAAIRGFSARCGSHSDPQRAENPQRLPFAGLKVVDLGTFWAGPYCTMYLGSLGAEVIKVESTRRPDGFRFSGAVPEMGDDWYERGGIFAAVNLNKRDVTLELSNDEGRALFLKLIEGADVLLENFSARVIEQFGLDYADLRAVRPDLVMVRMPGFGLEGPWRDYVGWAMVIEQATGMASVTGPPEVPMHPGGLADPVIGMHAAVALQAALEHRDRTGEGQRIEVAQLETGANVTAELVIEWSARGEAVPRDGNREAGVAPQGVYACRAETPIPEWVAITVADDEQWLAFAAAIGRDDWGRDVALRTLDGRRARHDDLDEGIDAWTQHRSPHKVIAALRPLGIPVATVLQVPRMYSDPQLNARGWFVDLDHATAGRRRYPGWPMRFSFADVHHRFGAPTLGQHNHEILRELGCTDADITQLEARGVIGTRMAY
jgi:crotonobetainyl-CoA:carnitine CoA-transferase CaiB-like acyl-CoA transferase